MSKTKLVFLHYEMHLGGVETALVSALRLLDPSKYDITLMLTRKQGLMLSQVPEYVKVEEIPFTEIGQWRMELKFAKTVLRCFRTFHWYWAVRMMMTKLRWFCFYRRKGMFSGELDGADLVALVDWSRLPKDVDFALAYSGGSFQALAVKAWFPKAVTAVWFHNEGTTLPFAFQREAVRKCDYRFCCSKSMTDYMTNLYGVYGLTFATMPHVIDFDMYRKRANEGTGFEDYYNGIRLLTVGRVDYQKGIDIAIESARMLKEKGYLFRWYVIGRGFTYYRECLALVEKYGLSDRFVFLDRKENPFPYYRECDIYVQPSRWEAYCLTVAEARAFAKPIVSTDFVGIREQIEDGATGYIAPVGDAAALAEKIETLLKDESIRTKFSAALDSIALDGVSAAKCAWHKLLDR